MSKIKFGITLTSITFASIMFTTSSVFAEDNPFHMDAISSGEVVAHGHGKSCKKKMKRMDTNKDGVVSKDEFMSYAEKKFAKKDKNGDGVLSADEMKRMKKHHHGKDGKQDESNHET